jgi:hypothetical protein
LSLHFYEEAATRGSVDAMNAIAFLSDLYPDDESICYACLRWNRRALFRGSVDAYRHRGKVSAQSDPSKSFLCYVSHFYHAHSLLSAFSLFPTRTPRLVPPEAVTALRYCFANGHAPAIPRLIEILKDDATFLKALWERVSRKGPADRVFKAHLNTDFSTPRVSSVTSELTDIFSRPSADRGSPRVSLARRRDGAPQRPPPRFPAEGRTGVLIQVFEFASPDFDARDLSVCAQFLSRLYRDEPRGILASALWCGKTRSKCPRDLVQCGFVAAILSDPEFAVDCFTRAAKLGDRTGSVMAGILLTHRLKKPRNACYFFAQCVVDPVALVYLGLLSGDPSQLDRAATVLGVRADRAEMYERIGDLFAHGVKFPYDAEAALMFYGQALVRAEAGGEDIGALLVKIERFDQLKPQTVSQ